MTGGCSTDATGWIRATTTGREAVKRSLSIRGHRTSVSLEAPFWDELAVIAGREGVSLAALVARVDEERWRGRAVADVPNLSSALRMFVLERLRKRAVSAG